MSRPLSWKMPAPARLAGQPSFNVGTENTLLIGVVGFSTIGFMNLAFTGNLLFLLVVIGPGLAFLGARAGRARWIKRQPQLNARMHAHVERIDRRLERLRERADEDRDVVERVGRGVLEARNRIAMTAAELRASEVSGELNASEVRSVEVAVEAEVSRALDVLAAAHAGLDEQKELVRNGRVRADELASRLDGRALAELETEMQVRRDTLRDLRLEMS